MKNLKIHAVYALCAMSAALSAAPPPPPSGGPGCWPPPCIPVDNGLLVLIGAGVVLGLKTLYSFRKKAGQSY